MARSLSTALVVTALFVESIVSGVYRGAGCFTYFAAWLTGWAASIWTQVLFP